MHSDEDKDAEDFDLDTHCGRLASIKNSLPTIGRLVNGHNYVIADVDDDVMLMMMLLLMMLLMLMMLLSNLRRKPSKVSYRRLSIWNSLE